MQPLISARGLAAGYDGRPALSAVSFEARAGDRVAVLGPNGGGKTTLFRVLLGELPARTGDLEVRSRCAIVPQTERSRLDFPVTALDVALMGALPRLPWWRPPGRTERRAALGALGRVGLEREAASSFGELSGGQRQRVLVARALVQEAQVMLMDEPYSGLDAVSAGRLDSLIDELAAEGGVVLVATHDIEHARHWDRVLCVNHRQIAFGPPKDVLTREVVEATYGEAIVDVPAAAGQASGRGIVPAVHHEHRAES